MRKLTNVSDRPETIVLASGQGGCYTGRRGHAIAKSITLAPGETIPANDATLAVPKVARLVSARRFKVENVPEPPAKKKPRRKRKAAAKKKTSKATKADK